VAALLRRAAQPPSTKSLTSVPGVEIDLERHVVKVQGKVKDLTPKEFKLLQLLIEADGKVLSGRTPRAGLGLERPGEIDTRTVEQHVARLRQKLGPRRGLVLT